MLGGKSFVHALRFLTGGTVNIVHCTGLKSWTQFTVQSPGFRIKLFIFQATRLGKHINELRRKSSDKLLANRAKNLVKKWRSLLSAPAETGPPPGGGNNNNSLAATNGNTASRLNAAVAVVSPGLPRSNISPGLPRSNISPGLPMRAAMSPALRNNISPGIRSNISPGLPLRPGSIPAGLRSARASPSVSRSATPRVSPATVTISSSGSSPSNSRPTSPHEFVPINSAGPSLHNSRNSLYDVESNTFKINLICRSGGLISQNKYHLHTFVLLTLWYYLVF